MPRCVQILHWFSDRFWIDCGPKIDSKINPKSIKKFFQNQPTNKSYFSFIFDQIPKTISCSSKWPMFKNRSKTLCFCVFFRHPLMPTKGNTRHATHSTIMKNHIQNQWIFIEIKWIFDHFWHRFPSPKFGRLGEGLGLDFGLDFRPCWGPKRRPNGIKKSSRKKVPT